MDETNIPELARRIDFRHLTLNHLNDIINSLAKEFNKDIQLIFLTNFAFVQGKVTDFTEDDVEDTPLKQMAEKAVSFRNRDIIDEEERSGKQRAVNDGAFIMLKDVSIQPFTGSKPHTIAELMLFVDQIVGVSVAKSNLFD